MVKLWSRRIILATLLAMIGSLYIVAGVYSEVPAEEPKKEESAEKDEPIKITDSAHLKKVMKENDFKLNKRSHEEMQVTRTFIQNFPQDMKKVKDRRTKEELFVASLLPYILHENEIILGERKQLLEIKKAVDAGKALKPYERSWLTRICDKYKLKKVDIDELLRRADIIPPSLALGQAIIETGMGSSYAALKKNSAFGMTVSKKVLAYKSLKDSVGTYIRNLNSNNAYRTMRKTRAELRKAGKPLDSNKLIGDMIAYCEFKNYIGKVRSAIKSNDLVKYDNVNLAPKDTA